MEWTTPGIADWLRLFLRSNSLNRKETSLLNRAGSLHINRPLICLLFHGHMKTALDVVILIESFAKARETHLSVLHFIALYCKQIHCICFCVTSYYTLLHLSYYILFHGFLQTTLQAHHFPWFFCSFSTTSILAVNDSFCFINL